jgi:Toprim domain
MMRVPFVLGVAEGLETALSMRLLPEFGATALWALVDAHNLESFPVMNGLVCLFIAVDNDLSGTGNKASNTLAQRYLAAGIEVVTLRPRKIGNDLNDVVREPADG